MTSYGDRMAKAILNTLHGNQLPFLVTADVPGWPDFITLVHGNGSIARACYWTRDRRRAITPEAVEDVCDQLEATLRDQFQYPTQRLYTSAPDALQEHREVAAATSRQALDDWRKARASILPAGGAE